MQLVIKSVYFRRFFCFVKVLQYPAKGNKTKSRTSLTEIIRLISSNKITYSLGATTHQGHANWQESSFAIYYLTDSGCCLLKVRGQRQ